MPPHFALPRHAPGLRIGLFGGTFDPPHEAHRVGLPAGDEAARPRPGLVAGDAGQSAQGHPRAGAAGGAHRGGARARPPSAHRRHRPRSPQSAPATPTRPWLICARTVRACASSGSWAPTICAASIAGRSGAGSPPWCRSRWSTASGRASTRPASAAGQALARARIPDAEARSLPDRKPPAWVYLHGLKSPLSSTALRARAPAVIKAMRKCHTMGIAERRAVETVNRPCLS